MKGKPVRMELQRWGNNLRYQLLMRDLLNNGSFPHLMKLEPGESRTVDVEINWAKEVKKK